MARKVGITLTIVAFLGLAGLWPTLSQQAKKVELKVLVPERQAKVTVEKKDIEGDGLERQIKTTVEKDEISVSATWEPNGYTKMVRTRKVSTKGDSPITVDLRTQDPKNPDDITVIYVPTPDDVVEEMARISKIGKNDIVYDLGCGDGRMVITAVKKFGAKKGVGVDLDIERVKESQDNAKKAGVEDKVTFRKGDVLKVDDLSDANVVMLYMGDDINLRLRPILQKTLKPGSRIVSHRFKMGDWKPAQTVTFRGKNGYDYELHLWIIGDEKK